MKSQLSIKTKMVYFLSEMSGTSAVKNVVETMQDYNRTNVLGNLKSLSRKGLISCTDKKLTNESKLSLTDKGINFITKKLVYVDTDMVLG